MPWFVAKPFADTEMQRKLVWVAVMLDAAVDSARDLRVSPAAIVAQAAQETGWGASIVGQHNLFGVKATADWKGVRVLWPTAEVEGDPPETVFVKDWFRDYESFDASIADHLAFLRENSRYRDAGVFAGMGDTLYFQALQRAGYATDLKYAVNCIAVLDTVVSFFMPHLTQPSAPTVPVTEPHRWLLVGVHGADVADLQRRLGMPANQSDGWFGKDTKAAVVAFQRGHSLVDDGVVGDATWAALAA